MKKTKISELNEFGQSVWLDHISRELIEKGKLKEMIGLGLRGMTSNPTIFDKAISGSSDYDKKIRSLCSQGKSIFEIYDELTVKDMQDAADMLKPVYEETERLDGYVSLEVSPELAFKTEETVDEGKRLHRKVNRPNVMFKVPSTDEGIKAAEELTASGINVNVTLIFSLRQYREAARAYINGVERFIKNGGGAGEIRSVASVFVSRIDTVCDRILDSAGPGKKKDPASLKGKAAVANSARIYEKYLDIFSSISFKRLREEGANIQRVLWGSTSTKNPDYADIKYISELIGRGTVNTMPQATLEAFLDHGAVKEALSKDAGAAHQVIRRLSEAGIDIDEICEKLLLDGVAAFEKSFISITETIKNKAERLCKA